MPETDGFVVDDPLAAGPVEQARAQVLLLQGQSSTAAGVLEATAQHLLHQHADLRAERQALREERKRIIDEAYEERGRLLADARAESARILQDAHALAAAIQEAADRQRSEIRAYSRSTAEIVEMQVSALEKLQSVHALLSQPREREPSGMEILGRSFDKLTTELRDVGKFAIDREPRLLTGLAYRVGGAGSLPLLSSTKDATTKPGAKPAPRPPERPTGKPDAAAAPSPGIESSAPAVGAVQLSSEALDEVEGMLRELGNDYIRAFAAETGVRAVEQIQQAHVDKIRADYQRVKAAQSAQPA